MREHWHCPEGCEKPQPFEHDFAQVCGRCWHVYHERNEMVLCTEETCPGEGRLMPSKKPLPRGTRLGCSSVTRAYTLSLEGRAKRRAAMLALHADPAFKAKNAERMRRLNAEKRGDRPLIADLSPAAQKIYRKVRPILGARTAWAEIERLAAADEEQGAGV